MKKLLLILLAAAAFYIGGAFRFAPLMIMAAVIVIMFPVMFILSRRLGKNLNIHLKPSGGAMVKNIEASRAVVCENSGRLPVSRFRAEITASYRGQKPVKTALNGSAEPKGKTETEFKITAPHCGLIRLELKRLKTYDYTGVFAASKTIGEYADIAVYPAKRKMKLNYPPDLGMSGYAESAAIRGGEDTEIRQLRKYERGDSARLIHKNLSARMGEPWVKELERQADHTAELNLDMGGAAEAEIELLDAFYEVLSALAAGLLKNAAAVRINCVAADAIRTRVVRNYDEIRGALLALYQTDPKSFGKTNAAPDALTLSVDLVLSRGGERITKFTAENLGEELSRVYDI